MINDCKPCRHKNDDMAKTPQLERCLVRPAAQVGSRDGIGDVLGVLASDVARGGVVADGVLIHGRRLASDHHVAAAVDGDAADFGRVLPH